MRTKNIPTPYQAYNSNVKSMAVFFVFAIIVVIITLSVIPPLWAAVLAPIALGMGILALGCCAFALSRFFGRAANASKKTDQTSEAPEISDPGSEADKISDLASEAALSPISKATMPSIATQTTTPERRPNASAASNQTVNPARGNWFGFGSFFSPQSTSPFSSVGRRPHASDRSEISSTARKMENTAVDSSDLGRGFQTLSPDALATIQEAARANAARQRLATGSSALTTPPRGPMVTDTPTTVSPRALQRWSDAPPASTIGSLGLGSVGSAVSLLSQTSSPTAVQRLDFDEPARVQTMARDAGDILASQAKAADHLPDHTDHNEEEDEDPYADCRGLLS
jgi:hypothetical protein